MIVHARNLGGDEAGIRVFADTTDTIVIAGGETTDDRGNVRSRGRRPRMRPHRIITRHRPTQFKMPRCSWAMRR